MSAKKGLTFSIRLAGTCLLVAFALMALASSASAAKGINKTYLALGDSLAFGYSQQLYNEHESEGDPASFFNNGYVDAYALKLKQKGSYAKVNLGCPGESTKSLIGNKGLAAALEASSFKAKGAAPCGYQEIWAALKTNGKGGPLHVEYAGKSQLEAALEQTGLAAALGRPVSKITFNIGANDQLALVKQCEKEVGEEYGKEGKSKYGATPEAAVKGCIEAHLSEVLGTIIKNTEAAAYTVRHGSAFGSVDYSGPIVFQLGYDPYGNVSGAGEVLKGSVGLAAFINGQESVAYTKPEAEGGFGPCLANPLPKFNPQNKKEPERLQAWTNMANTSKFGEKANGPDIHPTPAGYAELAKVMHSACGG
jgi:lysophospholipase L1-like esterase